MSFNIDEKAQNNSKMSGWQIIRQGFEVIVKEDEGWLWFCLRNFAKLC